MQDRPSLASQVYTRQREDLLEAEREFLSQVTLKMLVLIAFCLTLACLLTMMGMGASRVHACLHKGPHPPSMSHVTWHKASASILLHCGQYDGTLQHQIAWLAASPDCPLMVTTCNERAPGGSLQRSAPQTM